LVIQPKNYCATYKEFKIENDLPPGAQAQINYSLLLGKILILAMLARGNGDHKTLYYLLPVEGLTRYITNCVYL
jgi:hypothetical protein